MKKLNLPLVFGLVVLVAVVVAVIAVKYHSGDQAANEAGMQYEVLSPWADVDPMPLRGLTAARVDDLAGKKIGIFANYKRAAMPSAQAVEKQLKAKYPSAVFSTYHSTDWNVNVIETKDKEKFESWVKGQDALVATIGD